MKILKYNQIVKYISIKRLVYRNKIRTGTNETAMHRSGGSVNQIFSVFFKTVREKS